MTDAAGFGRPQPRPARELRPARIGGSASPAARLQSAIPVRIVHAGGPAATRRPAGQPGMLGLPQKVLISLMVVGTVVALIGSGSFATFNAATKNAPGITTGVLVLGDKVNAASECFSAGGASVSPANNTACTGVWSIATETPGTAISPLQMTIRNAGSIRASALSLYAAGACANSHAGAGYDGTGVICSQVQLEIQQYTDNTFGTPLVNTTPTTAAVVAGAAISIPVASSAAFTINQGISLDTAGNLETSTITAIADATHITATLTKAHASGITVTGSHCWYGSLSGTSCLAEANKLPAACNVSTCTSYLFADAAKTLTNFGTTVTSGSPINVGAVNSGASTYFLVFASLPGNSGDSFQGRRADLTFTWLMVQ